MVRGSQVALKHVINDMEARTLVMELRRRAIKRSGACPEKLKSKKKKKKRSSEIKLFHIYFATFLVENIIFSAIF